MVDLISNLCELFKELAILGSLQSGRVCRDSRVWSLIWSLRKLVRSLQGPFQHRRNNYFPPP